MIKLHALNLLSMCFPQDKPSKLNHCLTEIQVTNMLKGALLELPNDELLPDLLRKRVLQVVQNRKHPRTRTEWINAYSLNMQSRIVGEVSEDYTRQAGEIALEELGTEWMVTTPAEAVQAEMECWDD